MNRRSLLLSFIASPFLCWLKWIPKNGDEPFTVGVPLENIEDGDRGVLIYYDFQYSESKRVKQPKHCRLIEAPPVMQLQTTYLKEGLEITWDWHCVNPVFDGYPFNIKRFIANPVMDKNGIQHSHSNACDIPFRMYGPNKFVLNSINFTNPFTCDLGA